MKIKKAVEYNSTNLYKGEKIVEHKKKFRFRITGNKEWVSLDYAASEFCGTGLTYHFDIEGSGLEHIDHKHTFDEILYTVLHNPDTFRIPEEHERDYSAQELRYLRAFQERLLQDQ